MYALHATILHMTPGEQFVAFILYAAVFVVLLWLPFYLFKKAWESWVAYIRGVFYAKQKYTLLELRIPRGSAKSPLAMELFLNSLIQGGGEGGWVDKYWKGSTRSWFSLEIVSIEGVVRFFIWTKENFAGMIRAQVYGQFPDTEVVDMSKTGEGDYAKKIPFDLEKYSYWCGEFQKKNAGHFPIRTYRDYGLDKDPKEEFKIDPITPLIEYLGDLGKGEQAWIQIGVRTPGKDIEKDWPKEKDKKKEKMKEKKMKWYEKALMPAKEMVDWTDAAKDEIKKLAKRDLKIDKEKPLNPADMKLTPQEEEKVEAVERSLSKPAFDTTIRAVYVGTKDAFQAAHSAALTGTFKQYNTMHLNSFEVKSPNVKYAWQDKGGKKVAGDKKKIFTQYQSRAFFYKEFIPVGGLGKWKSNEHKSGKPFIMNIEELATVYHFPGDVAKTPTLTRVMAKKGEAPSNLPI